MFAVPIDVGTHRRREEGEVWTTLATAKLFLTTTPIPEASSVK